MKLDPNSQIALQKLVGAYLIRPDDNAKFIITGFFVEVGNPVEILVGLEDASRVEDSCNVMWSGLKDWTLKLPEENNV